MKYCNRPFRFMYLAENGNVRACPWNTIVIGNVFESSIEEMWKSEQAEIERNSIKDQSFRYCNKKDCPYCENAELPDISEEELMAKEAGDLPDMINIAFDYTCNHKCPSCRDCMFVPDDEYKQMLKKEMELVLPYLNRAHVVTANGMGDLFANQQLLEFIGKLEPEIDNFTFSIETNGVLFNEKNWEKIKKLGNYNLKVTVTPNSFNPYTYKALTGGFDNLETLKHNLEFISELRRQELINEFHINAVIQARNFHEMPEFVQFCLEHYAMDRIDLKPINKWFKMSSDEYWFRDVLNPLNPLHQDYLEVMKDPIFKDPHVYLWSGGDVHPKKKHPAYKYKDMLQIAAKVINEDALAHQGNGKTLAQKLYEKGFKSIILYGDVDLTDIVIKQLKAEHFPVEYVLGRFNNRTVIDGISVKCLDDYPCEATDSIMVINFPDIENIIIDMNNKKFKGELFRISDLYDFE